MPHHTLRPARGDDSRRNASEEGAGSRQAALPLQPGDIVIAGCTYDGEPPGACEGICEIDAALTTVTPITGPLPPGTPPIVDLVVAGPGRVVLLGSSGFAPTVGTLLQHDPHRPLLEVSCPNTRCSP